MKFEHEQRVIVPGQAQVQGVIVGTSETVPGFPVYMLMWLSEKGILRDGQVGEGDLLKANPLVALAEAIEDMAAQNELTADLPFPSGHKTTIRAALPSTTWRKYRRGKPIDVAHRLKGNRRKVKVKAKRKR